MTGGSKGIGAAISIELASLGAKVIAMARSTDALSDLSKRHKGIVGVEGDVNSAEDRANVFGLYPKRDSANWIV